MKYNFEKVFFVFRKNYQPVPLEIFGKDPYKTLVSTLLSSRTRDEATLKASNKLFEKAPNVRKLGQLEQLEIRNLIYPVGFYKAEGFASFAYRTKAKHLKKLAQIILEDFNGKIPMTRTDLVRLPGVGRKTANLVLNRAFGIPAIAVDTHVHKISNMLGWVRTKTPMETEKKLARILPKKYWSEINRLFVSVGQRHRGRKLAEFLQKHHLIS